MDGFPANKTYSVTPTTPEFVGGVKQRDHFLLYSNNSLTSGDHTLKIQITDCESQTFELDYIIYTPSFSTLASKPSITSSTGQLINTTDSATENQTKALQSSSPASTSTMVTSTPDTQRNANTSSSPATTAIVGGTLGGVIFLVLLALFIFLCRRRSSKRPTLLQPTTPTGMFCLSR